MKPQTALTWNACFFVFVLCFSEFSDNVGYTRQHLWILVCCWDKELCLHGCDFEPSVFTKLAPVRFCEYSKIWKKLPPDKFLSQQEILNLSSDKSVILNYDLHWSSRKRMVKGEWHAWFWLCMNWVNLMASGHHCVDRCSFVQHLGMFVQPSHKKTLTVCCAGLAPRITTEPETSVFVFFVLEFGYRFTTNML